MAFKMKGSAFKLNNVATKSALKQTKEEHKEIKDRLKGEDLTEAERKAILDKLKAGYEKEKESEEKAPTQMKSPMKQEVVATTEPVEETEEVVEEKVNPYGDPMRSVEANTWKQINTGDISENWKNLQEQLARSEKHGYDTKGLKKTMREVQRVMERRKLPLL